MEKYPYIKCLNPRRIFNPYTRESLVVECGHCPACSLRKSALNSMKVRLESLSHKYNMFITLTYNNLSLPRMMLRACNRYLDDCGEVCDTGEQFSLIDITQRLGTQGTIIGHTSDYFFITETLSKKVELPSTILPHLSKYDAQLFIKRLRINIQRYYEKTLKSEAPKIRYYLVGEYGPVHFRPHYHVILWFEDDQLYKIIRQILHQSWPFGRIDCQKSAGNCCDYVAKYLNSSVSLPSVFKFQQVRPFAIHSAHLGEKVLEVTREEIYENDFESVIKRSVPNFSLDSDVFLWRSLKAYFYPKCKGYAQKSEHERLYSYSTYVKVFRWCKQTSVAQQARIILLTILYRFYHIDLADDMYTYDDDLLDYFQHSSMFNPYNYEGKKFNQHLDDVYRRIYMELRLSKHFHQFVCKGFVNSYNSMMFKIDEFWSRNDYYNLKTQMEQLSEYSIDDWFEEEDGFQYFYHNLGFDCEKFKKSKAYRFFNEVTNKNADNAVKHKKLNDLNKIYINN